MHVNDVTADLGHLVNTGVRPYIHMSTPPSGLARQNGQYGLSPCLVRDARARAHQVDICTQGFEMFELSTDLACFDDPAAITTTYYAEIACAAQALCGAKDVRVFDHQIRRREPGRPALGFGRPGDGSAPTALGRAHNDYSRASAMRRFKSVFPELLHDVPFAILNFWRPIENPVLDTPLAVCDARTVQATDWVSADVIYPDRVGEIQLLEHRAGHGWYYYPAMQPHEVLVFVSYASQVPQRSCPLPEMTPHCAFDLPDIPHGAPLRQSIETRCMVLL